jgi:hypothetical protein
MEVAELVIVRSFALVVLIVRDRLNVSNQAPVRPCPSGPGTYESVRIPG